MEKSLFRFFVMKIKLDLFFSIDYKNEIYIN